MTGQEFFDLCEKGFSYLKADFGFEIKKKEKFDWGYKLFLKNSTTGIIITFEFRDFYVFLEICRLENGSFIDDSKEIRPNSILNNFDYEDLLQIRSQASIYPEYTNDILFNDDLIKKIVKHHSKNLKKYAIDVLKGDFTIYKELDRLVKERAIKSSI